MGKGSAKWKFGIFTRKAGLKQEKRIFAEQRINVEGLKAFRIEDDQSLQVFEVVIPEQVDTRSLHRIMGERAKRMGLRLSMQHAAIFEAIHRVRVV